MLLCPQSELGPEPPRQRHRSSAARIRKRAKCCCGSQEEQQEQEEEQSGVSPSHSPIPSYSQSLTSLARITAAALAAAAMLHTTNALATGSSTSLSPSTSSAAAGTALPSSLGTATPTTHELNATQLGGTLGLNLSESGGAGSNGLHTHAADEDWLDNIVWVFKAFVMLLIIIAAICGNLLVIISVMRVRKLRYVYVIFQLPHLSPLIISCEKAIRSARAACNSLEICMKRLEDQRHCPPAGLIANLRVTKKLQSAQLSALEKISS